MVSLGQLLLSWRINFKPEKALSKLTCVTGAENALPVYRTNEQMDFKNKYIGTYVISESVSEDYLILRKTSESKLWLATVTVTKEWSLLHRRS